jgi:hypothetical protein
VTAAKAESERTQPVPAQDTTAFATTMLYQPESPDAANTAKPGSAQNSA